MATNSEKIQELTKSVAAQSVWQLEREKDWQELIRLRTATENQGQRISVVEEKCRMLEKQTDRAWQLAPLVISTVAILVSLFVAFVKK